MSAKFPRGGGDMTFFSSKSNKAVFTYKAMDNLTPQYITDDVHCDRRSMVLFQGVALHCLKFIFSNQTVEFDSDSNASSLTSFKDRIKSIV